LNSKNSKGVIKLRRLKRINDYALLSQKVYSILRTAITNVEIQFGEKINVDKIAKTLKVSITPVREAIHKLVAEGILVTKPNQGTLVREISLSDIDQILQARLAIEKMALSFLISKIAKKDDNNGIIKNFDILVQKMKESVVNKNIDNKFAKHALDFHSLIFKKCGNKYLYKMYMDIENLVLRFTSKSLNKKGRIEDSYKEHFNIYTSIKEKDIDRAKKYIEEHIENAWKTILKK